MSQDTNVENLIINKLTKAQYESIATPDPTQLYFITDEVISSSDVVNALGYTPYNATNPAGYISSAAIASLTDVALTGLADGQVLKYNSTTQKWENSAASGGGTWGSITGTLSNQTDLQNALDAKQNTISDLSTIRSGAALGATSLQPNDNITELVNNAGYITGITSSDVTTALGYTPYNSTNPNGYITASALTGYATETYVDTGLATKQATLVSGTNIKTINNNSILGSGDLTLDGLPTQTGQSGKFLTTDGTDASWGNLPVATASTVGVVKPDNASIRVNNDGTISAIYRNVGEIIQSSLPLTDAGLHLLDGSLLQYGIYKEFIDYIADLYAENPSANYFTDETSWQTAVTTYGVCGKFVYDSTNNTVRLPKVTGKIDGTTDINALGDLEPLFVRLPNITGTINTVQDGFEGTSGALYVTVPGQSTAGAHTNAIHNKYTINIDASRSSSVYSGNGSNTEIHEQAIKMFIYIVIATSSKTDIQVDIDEIATDLNGKADVDLTNTAATLSNDFLSKLMPDYENAVNISATVTTTSTQNRSYSYPIMLYFAASNTDISGGYIKFTCGNFETNTQGYSYNLVSDTLFVPANTNFTLYCPIQPNRSCNAYIIPLKGGNLS